MSDGITTNVVLSGATLLGLLTLGVKLWISGRPQRISPQPLEVRAAEIATPRLQCDERHHEIDARTSNLFARVSNVEQRLAAVESSHRALESRLTSIDNKLDALLRRS